MLKKYKFGIDAWAIWFIAAIMLPNIIWALSNLPNDILKNETLTPVLDNIMTIAQVLMIVSLCLIRNKETQNRPIKSSFPAISAAFCMFYYSSWIFYFCGSADSIICLFRKNAPALLFTALFSVFHIMRTVLNFLV